MYDTIIGKMLSWSLCCKSMAFCARKHIQCRNVAVSSKFRRSLRYLDIAEGRKIVYRKLLGSKKPTIVFIPGFMSSMEGTKAVGLERFCREHDHSCVR